MDVRQWRKSIGISAVVIGLAGATEPARAVPIFIGEGQIAGTALDGSGLSGLLEDGVTPRNLAGGFGSAMTYTGSGTSYIMVPDRGPADGTTTYQDRMYTVGISVTQNGGPNSFNFTISPTITDTKMLTNEIGQNFTGSSAAFASGLRYDPEGVAIHGNDVYISDEYGPYINKFDRTTGLRTGVISVPSKFGIANPSATGTFELPPISGDPNFPAPGNTSGRQANRGMEGLAISPDGTKLFGIMQSPLIQDGGLNTSNQRRGVNNRILELDLVTGQTKEYLYQLDNRSNGVNEIVAIDNKRFMVIERDGNAGTAAATKKVFTIDLTNATDISNVANLPQTGLPGGVVAVTKAQLIDLLAPAHGLAGSLFPEKIEGLAFGPDLTIGGILHRLLLVSSDNDFIQANPTRIFAFAIPASELATVPLPAAAILFGSGLSFLAAASRRRSRRTLDA